MPWVKVYTDLLDDPKVGQLNDAMKWRFVALILLAGECDAEGGLTNGKTPMTVEEIAWRFRITPHRIQGEIERLTALGLLKEKSGVITVTNFAKRQGRRQAEKRDKWRKQQARHRDNKTVTPDSGDVTPDSGDVMPDKTNVMPLEERRGESEKEIEEESEEKKDNAGASPLSPGQSLFLDSFGAKRLNGAQRNAISQMESVYGLERLQNCVNWASKKGMRLGDAVIAIEKAIPKWGQVRGSENGRRSEPKSFPALRRLAEKKGLTHG